MATSTLYKLPTSPTRTALLAFLFAMSFLPADSRAEQADPKAFAVKALLNPNHVSEITIHRLTGARSDPPNLYGFEIIDSVVVSERRLVVGLLSELGYELDHPRSGVTLCFNPRHALSVVTPNGRFDFLLCYECQNLEVYRDSTKIKSASIAALSEGKINYLFGEAGL